jgi:transketolase
MTSEELARNIRIESLRMVSRARASHIGGALSIADILAVLYADVLVVDRNDPVALDRDRFILSKGHSCVSLYASLGLRGFFPLEELASYGLDGSRLMTHVSHRVPGVEFSTGSLGHGLPFGCGKALAAKRRSLKWRTYVLLSDGEMDEGSNWEAMLFAAHHQLDNLVAIVDYNKIQSLGSVEEVMSLEPLARKFESFNWAVHEVDGHDHQSLRHAFAEASRRVGKPSVLIAHTVKGKGVSFMQNQLEWHYRSPSEAELESAISEISC